MLKIEEFKIELHSKYVKAEEEVLSEPERKLHVMALCMRDALKEYNEGKYREAFLEMVCVDSWAKQVKEAFWELSLGKLSEEEE